MNFLYRKQMITNSIKTVLLLLLFAGLFACNEDKGNYDYIDFSTIESIEVNDTTVAFGSTLHVQPKLKLDSAFAGASEADFDFSWLLRTDSDDNNQVYKLLAVGKTLDVEIVSPNFRIAQNRQLVFLATHKEQNIEYAVVFTVRVVNPMAIGYAALCDKEEGIEIDMLALMDQRFTFHTDVLRKSGSDLPRAGVKARDILAYNDRFNMNPFLKEGDYSMFVLTDQYTTRVKPADFSWKETYNVSNMVEQNSYLDTMYLRKGKPVIAEKIRIAYLGATGGPFGHLSLYHKEEDGTGNWYFYSSYMMLSPFSVQMNRVRTADLATTGQTRYEPAPHVSTIYSNNGANNGNLYYDRTQNVFMWASFNQTSYYTMIDNYYSQPIPSESSTLFLFNDPNYVSVVDMGEVLNESSSPWGYAILKQADNSYKYIEFRATSLANLAGHPDAKLRAVTIPASADLENARFIARMPYLVNLNYLYYVTAANQVYKVSLTDGSIVDITSSILKGDGYNEITLFKFTLPESYWSAADLKNTLTVGTYNASIGMQAGGKLEFFQPTTQNDGTLELVKYPRIPLADGYQVDMSWTGFGKIIGLTYKRR